MSGAEIGIAVIGAVAALITAYRDAGSIVENIKERRKARGTLPPSVALEESLQEGHQEIEKITAKGIRRFGAEFEQGDDIAHRALQSLTIEVQASLLHHLTLASKDDHVINFEVCIDSAIEARLRAVTILNELYLRQQKRSSMNSDPEVVVPEPPPNFTKAARDPREFMDRRESRDTKEAKEAVDPREPREFRDSGKRSNTLEFEKSPSPMRSRKPSWNVFKTLSRTSTAEQTKDSAPMPATSRTPSSYGSSPALSPRPTMSSSPGSVSEFRRSQVLTPPISPETTNSSVKALTAAGFCKGAYYVQQGIYDKSVQVSMKNMEWACHCRQCHFATPADRDERGRPRFDDKIYSTPRLRFRSLLWFKSHLSSNQKKKRLYKCLICVLAGDSSANFDGEQTLLEHLSHHEGAVVSGVDLYGPICFDPSGPRIGSERTFDVCFADNPRFALPPSAFELDVREIAEADGTELLDEDVFKNQWAEEGRR